MKNENIIINEKEQKLNLSSNIIKEKSIYDKDFIINPDEKEIDLFNINKKISLDVRNFWC